MLTSMDALLPRGLGRCSPTGDGRADLHVHSLYSDGGQTPEAIVRAAAGRLDVVAITDHDDIAGAVRARDFARRHAALGVDVVVGEEISTLNGHLLGLYLSERVPPGLSARDAIRRVHAQGGLAVAAHPFHPLHGTAPGHRSIARLIPELPLDAIEVVNNAGVFSRLYDAWAALRNVEWMLPVTAGSDAHDVWYLGSAATTFPGRDAAALRRALVAGQTRALVTWSWTASKMPRHVRIQSRSALRFFRVWRQRRLVAWTAPTVSLRQGGHRGHS